MSMKPFLWTAALALALAPESMEAQTRLLRHPSWHDNKVAFSYFGDIWVANGDGSSPRRITDNRARDIYPRFSPRLCRLRCCEERIAARSLRFQPILRLVK